MDSCSTSSDRLAAAVAAIRRRWSCPSETAVILGTGLGELADEIDASMALSYGEIPGFTCSTALAHRGRLVCGELSSVPVVMMQGRCHGYEGYSLDELTFPVRVLAALGITTLVVTNASGGLNPQFAMGDVMVIEDHISLMWIAGTVAPDGCALGRVNRPQALLYDRELAQQARETAWKSGFALQRGTYVAVTGPSYETRAEYRAFRRIGGDCVGMSTVPEVLAAAACGVKVLGLSTITNVACPDAPKIVSAEEVVEVARIARPRVRVILQAVLNSQPA